VACPANLAFQWQRELREYPMPEPEDIQACCLYAYRALAGDDVGDHGQLAESLLG